MKFSDIVDKPKKVVYMNFSIGASPVKVEDKPTMKNFSADPNSGLIDYQLQCFSLLERVRLSKKTPRQILRLRVNEVLRFLRSSNTDKIKENKALIIQYLNEYIYEIIVKLMNDPTISQINLMKELGLQTILRSMNTVRKLQRFLVRAKREYKIRGYLSKVVQQELNSLYQSFINEFLVNLETRYLRSFPDKNGILSGNDEVTEQNPMKLAAFSEDSSNSDILDAIYEIFDTDDTNCERLFVKLDELDSNQVFKDAIMDDPELTKRLNSYIANKSDGTKSDLRSYLTRTVEFSKDLQVPNFSNLTMEKVIKLSGGSLPEVLEEMENDKIEDLNNKAEEVNDLSELLPPADDLLLDSPNYKVNIIDNFGNKIGVVAIKQGKQFSVNYYKLSKSVESYRDFSKWGSRPYKSIKISSQDLPSVMCKVPGRFK